MGDNRSGTEGNNGRTFIDSHLIVLSIPRGTQKWVFPLLFLLVFLFFWLVLFFSYNPKGIEDEEKEVSLLPRLFCSAPQRRTGPRRIRLISGALYLHERLNKLPNPGKRESLVWIRSDRTVLSYNRVRDIMSEARTRARTKKKALPHLFLHRRPRYFANLLTEAQMREVFSWVQASAMAAIYFHITRSVHCRKK